MGVGAGQRSVSKTLFTGAQLNCTGWHLRLHLPSYLLDQTPNKAKNGTIYSNGFRTQSLGTELGSTPGSPSYNSISALVSLGQLQQVPGGGLEQHKFYVQLFRSKVGHRSHWAAEIMLLEVLVCGLCFDWKGLEIAAGVVVCISWSGC